ncbi:SgcJ/EcaC family oxidoreductase [Streptomyces sp. NPDC057616]|uniref:SgcJ/EcaC family oxidoreductase n=1 Tax=Streptomyces sp. NPDC057616 TaxID=3346183 RepID=UPI0036A233EA
MTSDNTGSEDDRAVRAVLDSIYAAWADNDADAFAAPYAETATAVLPGAYLPGRKAIRDTMASLFAGELKGSSARHEVQDVRFAGADTAVVISKGAILLAGQTTPDPANRALETWVLARHGRDWRVQAFHNCPERAAVADGEA